MLAEQAEFHAERLFARSAVFARAIAHSGINRNSITGTYRSHVRPDLVDCSGSICSHHPWRGDRYPGQAAQRKHIEMVERGRANAHSDVVVRRELWRGCVGTEAQLIELAKLVDSGQLRVAIDSTFTLAQAAAAFERSLASGKRGKVVIEVADDKSSP